MDMDMLTAGVAILLVALAATIAERHGEIVDQAVRTARAFGSFAYYLLACLCQTLCRGRPTYLARGWLFIKFTSFSSSCRALGRLIGVRLPTTAKRLIDKAAASLPGRSMRTMSSRAKRKIIRLALYLERRLLR